MPFGAIFLIGPPKGGSYRSSILLIALSCFLLGCDRNLSFNKPLIPNIAEIAPDLGEPPDPALPDPQVESPAQADPRILRALKPPPRPRQLCGFEYPEWDKRFVGMALSGGGARAAVYSAAVMFELDDLGVLDHVDVISSASGGALTAALYGVSCHDPDTPSCQSALDPSRAPVTNRPKWERSTTFNLLSRDLLTRWFWNRFWPDNLVATWFTGYDNTDIFAETLSDNFFDTSLLGGNPMLFRDLHPDRPYLVINATNFTELRASDLFSFTKWDFAELSSDICEFELGRAVAASSAYPAFLNFTTLTRYAVTPPGDASADGYVHVFDAGASDNLALSGLRRAIDYLEIRGVETGELDKGFSRRATIFLVDAQIGFIGRPAKTGDPRRGLDWLIDRNFLDAYDTLMHRNYGLLLQNFSQKLRERGFVVGQNAELIHLPLKALDPDWRGYEDASDPNHYHERRVSDFLTREERLDLLKRVSRIVTDYGLEDWEVACLAAAAHVLVNDVRPRLADFVEAPSSDRPDDFANNLSVCRKADAVQR